MTIVGSRAPSYLKSAVHKCIGLGKKTGKVWSKVSMIIQATLPSCITVCVSLGEPSNKGEVGTITEREYSRKSTEVGINGESG